MLASSIPTNGKTAATPNLYWLFKINLETAIKRGRGTIFHFLVKLYLIQIENPIPFLFSNLVIKIQS